MVWEEGVKIVIRQSALAIAALLAVGGSASAQSAVKNIGGGWQVFIPDINVVDVAVDNFTSQANVRVIQKFAIISNFSVLDLIFSQIAPNAQTATRIAITDEFVLNNSTGQDWNGFQISLADQLGGSATFNQASSASLSFSPFTTRTYNGPSTQVTFGGGTIPANTFWTPGTVSGALWIDIALSPSDSRTNRTSFTLREQALPTPGTAALLGAGVVLAARRRRGTN